VVRLLESLRDTGFLNKEDADLLKRAYCIYRERTHRAALLGQPAMAAETEFSDIRSRVQSIWREKMECPSPP
jgi:glutamate-ammonia-ligase adenylyltransferase